MNINMTRIIGTSILAIKDVFRQWCYPDNTMVVPVSHISPNISVNVKTDGITAIVFEYKNSYWRAGYVINSGTFKGIFPLN